MFIPTTRADIPDRAHSDIEDERQGFEFQALPAQISHFDDLGFVELGDMTPFGDGIKRVVVVGAREEMLDPVDAWSKVTRMQNIQPVWDLAVMKTPCYTMGQVVVILEAKMSIPSRCFSARPRPALIWESWRDMTEEILLERVGMRPSAFHEAVLTTAPMAIFRGALLVEHRQREFLQTNTAAFHEDTSTQVRVCDAGLLPCGAALTGLAKPHPTTAL